MSTVSEPSRVELRTQRLHLRAWRDSDLEPFARMCADPRVMRWYPATMDRAATGWFMGRLGAHHAEHGYTGWAVEVLDSELGAADFVGYVGLLRPLWTAPFDHAEPCVEVGWRLDPDWWGHGIATEAASAALDHGFDVVGLPEVLSWTVPPNLPSQAVMQRIGMQYEGVFDLPSAAPADWWRSHVLYRITREVHNSARQ